jgi:serine/threonine-protein kinase
MRYVEGGSFASYLRDQTSLSDRLQVLRQAALGVNHAHSEGLWHRDVKPENILVGKHGEVHVIDWGLVSVQGGKPYKLKLPRLRLRDRVLDFEGIDLLLEETSEALSTQSGLLAGTPRYMAPEQLMRDDRLMGPRSDIWSFGVMLYEAIAERHPFGPSTLLAPNTPPALISLCQRMLEKDPGRRPSTLAEFASELDAARGTSGQSLAVLPTTIATSNSPQIANLLVDNRQQREEIAVMRELLGTGLLRWRSRRALRRKLAELRSRSET